MDNGTDTTTNVTYCSSGSGGEIRLVERQSAYDLVCVVASLLCIVLSALIASFLGLLRSRQRLLLLGHDSTLPSSVYRPSGGTEWLRQDEIRL